MNNGNDHLSAAEKATEAQFWEYFLRKYDNYDAEHETLHDASIANAALQASITKNESQKKCYKRKW